MERIIHGDVLSPILAYMRLKGQHKVILESIPRDKETARFSILAGNYFSLSLEMNERGAQKLGMKFRRKLLPSALFKGNRKKTKN